MAPGLESTSYLVYRQDMIQERFGSETFLADFCLDPFVRQNFCFRL